MIEGGSNAAFFVFGYNPNEINGGHFHTFLAARARLFHRHNAAVHIGSLGTHCNVERVA